MIKFLWRLLFLTFTCLALATTLSAQQANKKSCDCVLTGICKCKVCECNFVSTQSVLKEPYTTTRSNGQTVKMVWSAQHSIYCPDEPGWQYDFQSKLWYPPVQNSAQSNYQQFTQIYYGQSQFSGFQAGGNCANGQCGPSSSSGRVGFFRRR